MSDAAAVRDESVAGEKNGLTRLLEQFADRPWRFGIGGAAPRVFPADRFRYLAVGAVVDRLVTAGPADSVREGWYEAHCVCDWHTSGAEPVVDDASHEHVAEEHKAQVEAEQVFLAAARAYCLAKFPYDGTYATDDGRERHIDADMLSHARGDTFRAAVAAAMAAAAAVPPAAATPAPQRCDTAAGVHVTPHRDCILR